MSILKFLKAAGSYFLGVLLCLTLPTAIFVTGWIYRLAQRQAFSTWTKLAEQEGFELGQEDSSHLPSWSIKENLKTGFSAVVNAFLITLLPGVIMYFSWFAGWDNSFNKGYEQFSVGSLTGLLGAILFAITMLYLPMAQARQAVTGTASAFYDLRRVRQAAFSSPVASFLLAVGYFVGGFALVLSPVILVFVNAAWEELPTMDPGAIKGMLNLYYLAWCAAAIFPGYLLLKIAGARIYARATYRAYRAGHLERDALTGTETAWLGGLPQESLPPKLVRRGLVRVPARVAVFAVWVGFVFQVYVAQFFAYEGGDRWLRHPLVQLPWFRPIPAHLESPA